MSYPQPVTSSTSARRNDASIAVERGFPLDRPLLAVLDGAKGIVNESAAASLAEGLEETLTLHRLNVFPELGVSFKTTNLIESVMSRLEARTRRVTRWRTSDQKLRWCASALWAMERQFRRVKHHRHLPLLKRALQNKLSLTTSAAA